MPIVRVRGRVLNSTVEISKHIDMASNTAIALCGISLPVANVQEMVRNDPLQVPLRYLRNENDMPKDGDTVRYLS